MMYQPENKILITSPPKRLSPAVLSVFQAFSKKVDRIHQPNWKVHKSWKAFLCMLPQEYYFLPSLLPPPSEFPLHIPTSFPCCHPSTTDDVIFAQQGMVQLLQTLAHRHGSNLHHTLIVVVLQSVPDVVELMMPILLLFAHNECVLAVKMSELDL